MPKIWAEVIGDPIAHSLSPVLHRRWIEALGLQARYERTQVAAAHLKPFLARRRIDPDWRGCNVTAPHKRAVLDLVDRLTPAAERIGAVNCIFRADDLLVGDNTDVAGIAAALVDVKVAGTEAVILGAGGAAAPAVEHLLAEGAAKVVLLARDRSKAEVLRHRASGRISVAPFDGAALAGASIIINATPLGMTGAPPLPATILDALPSASAGAAVLDMVYRPERTPLLAAAEAAGLRTVGGLAMLLGQARPSFELLFGHAAPA